MDRKRHIQARERNIVEAAVFYMPADQCRTILFRWITQEQAGTGDIAIATFEISTF